MEKRKLIEARHLISQKRYHQASELLETMLDNDTAIRWYLQLQQLTETQKANNIRSWRNNRSAALAIAIIVLIALFLFLRAGNGL